MTMNRLWYDTAASAWTEALPIGNGRLGAMVFGGAWDERIQINESTFYNGGPYQPINPDAKDHLPAVRQRILDGKYMEAERLAYDHVMARPDLQTSYQPIGDLKIAFQHDMTTINYRRELDLETGIAVTRYDCDGVHYHRQIFASAIADVIVCKVTVDKPGSLSLSLLLSSPQNGEAEDRRDHVLGYLGRNRKQNGIPGALRFAFRTQVVATGGFVDRGPESIRVREADSVIIFIDAGTSFRRYDDVSGDPEKTTEMRLARASTRAFEDLLEEHVEDHRRLFGRMAIDIGPDLSHVPTDKRVRDNVAKPDPQLAALYTQYGRYLAIASSRPGTQPSNLQGIWNEEILPPWNSKFTLNINTQMNYWLADPANLAETFIPLIEMVEDLAETGQEMARAHYGARGWVVHHNTDIWRASGPIDGPKWGLWPTGGAWLCAQLYDHYSFSGDEAILRRIYPLMKGSAEFILDILVDLPGTSYRVTCPSLSPENRHPGGTSLCAGPAMDNQIIRDVFAAVISASEALAIDEALRAELVAARARLPEDKVGKVGQLQEWIEDWDVEAPEQGHRHVSHLYGLYPSHQIDLYETPALANAAKVALERRGDDATGWGIGWRINLWARLGEAERAAEVVQKLLSPEYTYPNLFDAHPPFQIDGNFGGAAGIIEMLVQSKPGEVRLLPALPKSWSEGYVRGVRLRGGVTLDMTWQDGQVQDVTLAADRDTSMTVIYNDNSPRVSVTGLTKLAL
ncbi:hypothetical protein C241_15883 [Bradyrhizobium lupini HPC(L)]|uniref:Glycosyl hydrolase family 95 N-terminal domain-containing protein n=1 Tax=Bradyrhizobium lupini HPC(L) TaxID=1229491 RepID=A0ABN0HJL4_RHILU|nr:hypothetical protein C241_15883 [Bradyrhizobium lupini HPC(L)]